MMKKLIPLAVIAVMLLGLGLAACGAPSGGPAEQKAGSGKAETRRPPRCDHRRRGFDGLPLPGRKDL